MKYPDDIRELLKRKFKNNHKEWLKASVSGFAESELPFEINIDIPKEQDALRQPENARLWISEWKNWRGSGSLVWSERRWRSLGTQTVPRKLLLTSYDDVVSWIGETARWTRAVDRFKSLVQRWSVLNEILPKYFNVLADYDETDFLRLCDILSWIEKNPNSNLYIRQIPVAGIDSKWLESRKNLFSELVAAIFGNNSKASDFYKYCGLKPLPQLIRMRILDSNLRKSFAGLGDITAPLEELLTLEITPSYVFIVENIQTGLAFEDMTDSIVIMGLGYGVDVLGKIPWLRKTRCIYWGDIDTHGFAILNQGRTYLPGMESILMDEFTLFYHQRLWVEEKDQNTSAELPLLTDAEQKVFQSLKSNVWGQNIRLEQERICWDVAREVLQRIVVK
ncbi:MAG: DUF2220 family protein [Treponema sp.]|nr:DUF2220 family protein [Treponema sp.]